MYYSDNLCVELANCFLYLTYNRFIFFLLA